MQNKRNTKLGYFKAYTASTYINCLNKHEQKL